jgi:hypothetical protein
MVIEVTSDRPNRNRHMCIGRVWLTQHNSVTVYVTHEQYRRLKCENIFNLYIRPCLRYFNFKKWDVFLTHPIYSINSCQILIVAFLKLTRRIIRLYSLFGDCLHIHATFFSYAVYRFKGDKQHQNAIYIFEVHVTVL